VRGALGDGGRDVGAAGDVGFDEEWLGGRVETFELLGGALILGAVVVVVCFARGGVGPVPWKVVEVNATEPCSLGGEGEAYFPA